MTTLRGDLLDPLCPTRQIIDVIGDKWSSIVILLLDRGGPARFNGLARLAEGISFKMLTRTLRRLEREGFVTREIRQTRPIAVSYALTPLARGLVPILDALRTWAETHIGEVASARAAYDRDDAERAGVFPSEARAEVEAETA